MSIELTGGLQLQLPPLTRRAPVWAFPDTAVLRDDVRLGPVVELSAAGQWQALVSRLETPVLRGRFWEVRVDLRLAQGETAQARVTGRPGLPGAAGTEGHIDRSPPLALPATGAPVTLRAILGTADRLGVDFSWPAASHAHLGIEVMGRAGAKVRLSQPRLRDVTHLFHGPTDHLVDLRDFGARADRRTDATSAFLAADRAAQGRTLWVPPGRYRIRGDLQLQSPLRMQGSLDQPSDAICSLLGAFDFDTYLAAFGAPTRALGKALNALVRAPDHAQFPLCGRRIFLTDDVVVRGGPDLECAVTGGHVIQNPEALIDLSGLANPQLLDLRAVLRAPAFDTAPSEAS